MRKAHGIVVVVHLHEAAHDVNRNWKDDGGVVLR